MTQTNNVLLTFILASLLECKSGGIENRTQEQQVDSLIGTWEGSLLNRVYVLEIQEDSIFLRKDNQPVWGREYHIRNPDRVLVIGGDEEQRRWQVDPDGNLEFQIVNDSSLRVDVNVIDAIRFRRKAQ